MSLSTCSSFPEAFDANPEGVLRDSIDWINTNYVGITGFTILLWDHIDTFVSEVEHIWKTKKKKSLIFWLFLLNRYLIPVGFILNLFAYFYPWPVWRCEHFVRYEGLLTLIGISVAEIIMFLRIRCLYDKQQWIQFGVGLLFLVQVIMNGCLLIKGEPVPHDNPCVKACTMIFNPRIGPIAAASAWLPLLYDTVIFALTLYRVLPKGEWIPVSVLKKRLLEDGIIYYGTIFVVTLVLVIMIPTAEKGLKNIAAQLELLITVTMMSRITLNLKRAGDKGLGMRDIDIRLSTPIKFARPEIYRLKQVRPKNRSDDGHG